MTLQSSGPIGMSQIAAELGLSGTLSLNDSRVRTLAGNLPGTISFANLYGRSSIPPLSVSAVGSNAFNDSGRSGGTVSAECSATPSGGVAPYTYLWSIVTSDGEPFIQSPGTRVTSLRKSYLVRTSGFASATLQCVVTDARGVQASANCYASVDWDL